MSPAVNRKLPRANLEQKIMILDQFHDSKRPQSEIVNYYRNQFAISTSSLSEWLKNEDDLRQRYRETQQVDSATSKSLRTSKRKLSFKYEPINKAMYKVVEERLAQNLPISEPILREYWVKFAKQYGVTDPKRLQSFSHGWLSTFKKRHGLNNMMGRDGRRQNGSSVPDQTAASSGVGPASTTSESELSSVMPAPEYSYPNAPPQSYDHQLAQPQPTFSNTRQQQQSRQNQGDNQEYLMMDSNGAQQHAAPHNVQSERYHQYDVSHLLNNPGSDTPSRSLAPPQSTPAAQKNQLSHTSTPHNGSVSSPVAQFQAQVQGYLPVDHRFPALTPRQTRPEPEQDITVDISDMEKFIFVYSERFFQQYGYQFTKSKEIFDAFKTKFMEEKLIYNSNGLKPGQAMDDFFLRRMR
ncbi:hypothetical protein KL923_003271 [Ogataea haglerorum]|uniref:HTH CENPB-type domain-containing protein n=1 Tax=Ogataea haglerorum TaxID=1937702 RepID=A0ABQ7RGQ9_9ASCO|nr:hypothetical protein KL923_003271 [Ogataea haglerorum]KAG7765343.1 hypothetical protein KL946_002400 [Ogataea haglerorum]KAG7789006.1 hypothetical protein KL910_002704 [Ogataea haglerorum]KAG7790538.1 hypothetical protein KL945_001419 [Ogataea haglerorum]